MCSSDLDIVGLPGENAGEIVAASGRESADSEATAEGDVIIEKATEEGVKVESAGPEATIE